ncbi:clarin-2 isoform X2 [Hyalella azteca]|nr:clarin-2 isoform X2 [Hyalella azteca]
MNVFKRSLILLSFVGCCVCLALVGAALGTRHWFVASCRQRLRPIPGSVSQITRTNTAFNNTQIQGSKSQEQSSDTRQQSETELQSSSAQEESSRTKEEVFRPNSTGSINFGLFQGDLELNVGFGERLTHFQVSETSGLMNQGLWVGTIACLCVGLLFAIAGAIFAIINTATTPVELITGVPGLYIWNSLAAVFTLVAVVLWSVLYHTSLSHNVLIEQSKDGWTTEGNEALGYSFWLVVVAII